MKDLSKTQKLQIGLFALSGALIILGLLFLINAMEVARLFPAYYDIPNVLTKYVIVILTMACGIMLFSNVAITLESAKLRNGLTIFITAFSTILTVPLVYVFLAIFTVYGSGRMNAIDEIMAIDKIILGFIAWFGNSGFLYVVFTFMLILSIIFIAFPLLTGILAVRGKTIKVGKQPNGKFGIAVAVLPVIAKQQATEDNA